MKKFLPLALWAATCMAISAAEEIPTAYFMADFNTEETMTKATVGKDMEFVNKVGDKVYDPIVFVADGKGVDKGDGYVYIPVGSYIKADFSELPGFVNPEDPDNPYVGIYSVALDVMIPKLGTYYCLFQSNPNNNTDSKLCLNSSGNFGSGFLDGYDTSWAASPDTWYRLTLTVHQPDGHYALYADGNLIKEGESGNVSKKDGRYALESAATLFFADDNEEDAPIYCSKIIFFDKALTAGEVKALGDPKTELTSGVESIDADNNIGVTVNGSDVCVRVGNGKVANVGIYGLTGNKVTEATVIGESNWSLADAVAGVYVVRVGCEGKVSVKKVFVK